MDSLTFESFSQNGEDVVLWRAFHDIEEGRYVDVGAYHPLDDSVTMGFYSRGWSGITIEPLPRFAALHRLHRPRDVNIEAAITARDRDSACLHVVDDTGLSTLSAEFAEEHFSGGYRPHELMVPTRRLDSILEEIGWSGKDIHFMTIDTEGSERSVLESFDLKYWRPWVLVIEATRPNTTQSTRHLWEGLVLEAGYRHCLFDGLSCFYVADERRDRLEHALSYPRCVLDRYVTHEVTELRDQVEAVPRLTHLVSHWRTEAVARWAATLESKGEVEELTRRIGALRDHSLHAEREKAALQHQIEELRQSTSWRLTRPFRALGALLRRL